MRLFRKDKGRRSRAAIDRQPDTSLDATPSDTRLPTRTDPTPPETKPGIFPDGIEVLHDNPDATVDICFVHGLTGDRNSTWTADGQSQPWPKTLLPAELPGARLLTYGYDAYVLPKSVASGNRLLDHANNLLHDLTNDRVEHNSSSRPLIFVAHSLGGLVCKEAILQSRGSPERYLRDIFDNVKGIIFMGTPHKGAWIASWARIPVSALGLVKSTNKSLLEILETHDQLLESIQNRFSEMLRLQREDHRPLEVTCFFEELPMSVFGKVVSKESATLDGYSSVSIHANHRDMAKFAAPEENGFKRLRAVLNRWEKEVLAVHNPPAPELLQDCLRSLAFPQMDDRSLDIRHAAEGTCQWLLRHSTYESWGVNNNGLLWIKGKPGSGKSTLLKYALDNRESLPSAKNSDLVLSFFFHGRGDELQKTPLGFFRSVLHQVLHQRPEAMLNLVDTFKRYSKEKGTAGEKWQWHQEELRHFFQSALQKLLDAGSVWLYIDALDECGEKNAVDLFQWLNLLLQTLLSTHSSSFHVCVSCRHYPIVIRECNLEICLEHENEQDISVYVEERLSNAPYLMAPGIPALITQCANGIFMWARLVTDKALRLDKDGVNSRVIERQVKSIPPELDELYYQLIREMPPASLKLIQWICFARRPLSLAELRWAMVVEVDCPYQSLRECQDADDYEPDDDRMKRRLQVLSRGLAEVTSSSHMQVIQFIHQSVRDFFLEKGLSALDRSFTSIDEAVGHIHYRLSRICIRYLAMEEIDQSTHHERNSLLSEFPFLEYATISWTTHTTESETRGISNEDLLEYFAWPSNSLIELWGHMYTMMNPDSAECPLEGFTLIHAVSKYGLYRPLRSLLSKAGRISNIIEAQDKSSRTPLMYAVEHGHEAIIRLLLEQGAAIEAQDKYGWTPLMHAALRGHEAIIRLLLEQGAAIEAQDKDGQTPLMHAVLRGHEGIVRLLLEQGAAIEAQDEDGQTPLIHAVLRGHEGIVRLLLEQGAAIEAQDEYGWTPLIHAVLRGHEGIVRLLLEQGAAIEAQDEDGWTPLIYAVDNYHEAIVRLLLERGAAIEAQDENGRTPLIYAVQYDHEAIIRLLLERGAVIEAQDEDGRTPLMYAVKYGHEATVQILQTWRK